MLRMRGYLGVAFVTALLILGAGTTAAASPFTPEGPALAFTALSTLKPRGFTVNTVGVGQGAHVLIRGSQHGVVPKPRSGLAWSADGIWVAFAGSRGARSGIYVERADGTGLRFLRGTHGGKNPVFSPDGRRIAFSRAGFEAGFPLAETPWVADVSGSGAHRVADWQEKVEYLPTSFSPDGSTLAVTQSRFGSSLPKVLLIKLDGSRGVRLLAVRASEAAFSPDGSQIAFVKHTISRQLGIEITHQDLYVMNADGTEVSRLTNTHWIAEWQPSWDPSGQRISFISHRISRDPIAALFDALLPFGSSVMQINADGTCRQKVISLWDAAIYSAVWRTGPGHEAGAIEC